MELDLGGPRRPMELQRLTGLSSSGITRLIDRLEERGLVQRAFGGVPGDRRATVISLTPEGAQTAGLLTLGFEKHLDLIQTRLVTLLEFVDTLDD